MPRKYYTFLNNFFLFCVPLPYIPIFLFFNSNKSQFSHSSVFISANYLDTQNYFTFLLLNIPSCFASWKKDYKRKQNHRLVLPVMTIKMVSIQSVLHIWKRKDVLSGVTTTSAKIKQRHPSQEFPEDILPITFTSRWRLIITCLASEQRDLIPDQKERLYSGITESKFCQDSRSWAPLFLVYAKLRLSHIAWGFLLLMLLFRLFFSVKLRSYCCKSTQLFVGGAELSFLPLPNYAKDVQVI